MDNDNSDDSSKTLTDSDFSKECRHFSPQDAFAKIANPFSNGRHKEKKEFFSEVLCRRSTGQTEKRSKELTAFGRFPLTMRVYEAKSEGHLTLSESISNCFDDMLIIRWHEDREDATPLVQNLTLLDANKSFSKIVWLIATTVSPALGHKQTILCSSYC